MSAPNVMDVAQLQALVSRSPFHRWLGLQVVSVTDDGVEVLAPWREELMSNPDVRIVHGGVVAALVDLTADLAVGVKFGHTLPTVDIRVDYHRPAVECALRAVGRLVKLGSTIATAEAWIYDPAGALVASGRGAYITRRWAPRTQEAA